MPENETRTVRRNLRDLLLDAIEQVKDGTLEPDRAAAVADLSQAVINADRFELDAMAFVAEHGDRAVIPGRAPLAIEHDEPSDDEPEDTDEDEEEHEPPKKEKLKAAPPEQEEWLKLAKQTLKKDQPLDLEEFSLMTKIPQAKLFKLLSDESVFERDTDSMYWLAK